MTNYKVRWREVSDHEIELTAEDLAELLGCSVEDVEEDLERAEWDSDEGLADALAEYSDQAFDGLTREDIEIEEC
ncbi:hypothetical protein ACFOOK_26425 [Micromonospora krabiensis]|uniref:Uncharacterized protein n=1 Tax=Micromonospora krabiensis TaxID=307121 RepID=A0A1C3N5S5_9ACTN|nr:hypothetical protein [Micromonospora krabiensis]SBV27896.1 hypothetical protein GA0070620_3427 [Micromonospora krabiensis]